MNIDDLTLGQIKEIAAIFPKAKSTPTQEPKLQIAVLDRGWVYVGRCQIENGFLIIENAACIRKWGTTKGLGELAANGPLPETKLDKAGIVRCPLDGMKHLIDVEESKWNSY